MAAKRDPGTPVSPHAFLATGVFARFTDALDRNSFAEAAKAQRRLAELGFQIHVQFQPPDAMFPNPEPGADGGKGAGL